MGHQKSKIEKNLGHMKRARGELSFDIGLVRDHLTSYARDVKDGAAVYLSAVLEE